MGFLPGIRGRLLMGHHDVYLVSSEVSLMKRGVGLSGAAENGAHDEVVFVQLTRSNVQVLIQS